MKLNTILCGDCLELMEEIPDASIDMVLCDLPYGITQNKKDTCIELEQLWNAYARISKPATPFIFTSQQPFTTKLINSNPEMFRYELIWDKVLVSGHLNANRMPLRTHENILVFYKSQCTYNPQKTIGVPSHKRGMNPTQNNNYGKFNPIDNGIELGNMKHPTSIIRIEKTHPSVSIHPTQKPVELFEWLIRTYTNEKDTVLDNCIGSGTTAVACINTNRNFIGIEKDQRHVDSANSRISRCLQ